MSFRDTLFDFVKYLEKRESLLRGRIEIFATGEEELLAVYLQNMNEAEEHDFIFPIKKGERLNRIFLDEGHWEEFKKNPQRLAQLRADKISYAWDALIETFSKYILAGRQYFVSSGGLKDSEKILRFMAREPRFRRRTLAQALLEILQKTPKDKRMIRVVSPGLKGEPYYVFLLFPFPQKISITPHEYRSARQNFLAACCQVTKLKFPDAKDIIGIATETGIKNKIRSEDACYFDASNWSRKMEKRTKKIQKKLGILVSPDYWVFHEQEYPDLDKMK